MSKTFTFEEYNKLFAPTEKALFAKCVQVIRKTVRLHGPRLVQQEIDTLQPRPVDRGVYRRSFHVGNVEGGAVLYNSAPHAPIIELGRRAGGRQPPISVIADWVIRKGLFNTRVTKKIGNRIITKTRRARRTPDLMRRARSVAYVIARAIAHRGLPAHRILEIASKEIDVLIRAELQKAIAEESRG